MASIEAFRIGDILQQRSTLERCEISGYIRAWPFGYFALRYYDGRNSKVSIGKARKRFRFIARPIPCF